MKRILGIAVSVFYGILAALAFTSSARNWSLENSDLGLWWAVIGTLLGIASLGAFFGTMFHTRSAVD